MEKQDFILKKIQKAELYLLVSFDKVCRENGLTYFLDSGTALGAVRHGGFIPWDDDIDVGMPRKDYERFMEIGQSLLPTNIFLQNKETEKNFHRYCAKLRLKDTVFPETEELLYENNGLFIDIFPFDYIPKNNRLAKLDIKFVEELFHIVYGKKWMKQSYSKKLSHRIFFKVVKLIPISFINWLESFGLKYITRNKERDTGMMTSYFWGMSKYKQYPFESKYMLPTKDVIFEGKKVRIMNDPDYYLKLMYGNYMTLPPKEKRVFHCKGEVNFGNVSFDL